MKAVRRLVLGTAAGLFIIPGVQAADMPVKAAPVRYVKICSLYGDGYYYVPGTNTCIKIGGFVRGQVEYNSGSAGFVMGSQQMAPSGRLTRDLSNDLNGTFRAEMSFDVRDQTEYGILRSYIRIGANTLGPAQTGATTSPATFWERAFIQFAGFTVGRTESFFDLFTVNGTMTYHVVRFSGDTFLPFGRNLWAYTAQFGNGFSATLSLEDPATNNFNTFDAACGAFTAVNSAALQDNAFAVNGAPCASGGTMFGFRMPDVVLNLRVDQAWGFVGISGAMHDASGAYYGAPNNVNNGHPADRLGWAASIGGSLNVPGTSGDQVGVNVVVAQGAPAYATSSSWWQLYNNSNRVAVAWVVDGIFTTGSDIELTRAWSVQAGYQHIWSPRWRTSLYGGYTSISFTDSAKAIICPGIPGGVGSLFAAAQPVGFNCNPDFSFYQVGSRTQWNPTPNLDIGLDIAYTRLNTAFKGPANLVANGSRPACTNSAVLACSVDDQDVWSAIFRWQRNFYP
jgi:Porin subfamily